LQHLELADSQGIVVFQVFQDIVEPQVLLVIVGQVILAIAELQEHPDILEHRVLLGIVDLLEHLDIQVIAGPQESQDIVEHQVPQDTQGLVIQAIVGHLVLVVIQEPLVLQDIPVIAGPQV
jgi:hypothetical protein